MNESLRDEVIRVFRDAGSHLDDKLVAECVSICQLYVLEPDTLRFKLEAINYRSTATYSEIAPITMESLSTVKKQIQQSIVKESTSKTQPKKRNTSTAQVDLSKLPRHMNRGAVQPAAAVKQEPFHEVMIASASNNDVIKTSNVTFVGPPMDLSAKKKRAYRYMYEKINERSESLDQIIDDFAELIRAHYDISELGDPSSSTDEEVIVVGRITHDAEIATNSKLVEGAICIESSRMLSSGTRVPLNFDPAIKIRGSVRGVGGIGIYPGAIVALKGKNGGGGYFLATEVLGIPPLKPSPSALGIINPKLDPSTVQDSISMLAACGPFTTDADISYKPWRALLHQIKARKPDVLLLVGPFVDAAHPKIKLGDIDIPLATLFKAQFIDPLRAFLTTSPSSIVLLVPSVRDLTSSHVAFPQPEFDAGLFDFHPRIHLLPNPARFSINDITFAATSVDSLFHLRKEEYFKRGVEVESLTATTDDLPNDAMANLCRHLLLQRSFYPIFPPPSDLSSEINLDMSHFDAVRMVDDGDLDYAPDVLIIPSRLKQFSKVIHSTTALNPSFLSKGTYGTISLAPQSVGTPKDRLSVEVTRLEAPAAPTQTSVTQQS
ncbi:DNA polymerase alpha, subunit B [Pholiota conissans]|uniref:DNA polymerase alpha subunit B n=1 Tax=Pholiota conissans TaxID=109636 RepID=A0A9P5ZDW2_9AGAR|nr:DNA polymerase alpha, subunit B [Pholiota conissans]